MRTSQLAEKKQTLAGMHRYQRDLLVVLARRSLVRSGLQALRMNLEGFRQPAWYPTMPNTSETLLGHLEGSARPAPTAPGALGTCPGRRLCLGLIPICEYSLGTLKFSGLLFLLKTFSCAMKFLACPI